MFQGMEHEMNYFKVVVKISNIQYHCFQTLFTLPNNIFYLCNWVSLLMSVIFLFAYFVSYYPHQTSCLSFFLHKCTFRAQFFSKWKRVNCGKISQNFFTWQFFLHKYNLWYLWFLWQLWALFSSVTKDFPSVPSENVKKERLLTLTIVECDDW